MNTHHSRRLQLAVTGLITVIGGMVLAMTAVPSAAQLPTPVAAHHAIIEGTPSCPGPDHVISWSIGNSQAKEDMTIESASAVLNGATYAVIGYVNPVGPSGTTSAATTIPGALTGTVTITVKGHWTDGHTRTNTADVILTDPCPVGTTTTTEPPTTTSTSEPPTTVVTTVPPSIPPSSVTPPPSTNVGPPASTCKGTVQPDGSCKLAFTGAAQIIGWTAVGTGTLLVGIALFTLLPFDPRRLGRA